MSGFGETPGYKGVQAVVVAGRPVLGGDAGGVSGGGTVVEVGGGRYRDVLLGGRILYQP